MGIIKHFYGLPKIKIKHFYRAFVLFFFFQINSCFFYMRCIFQAYPNQTLNSIHSSPKNCCRVHQGALELVPNHCQAQRSGRIWSSNNFYYLTNYRISRTNSAFAAETAAGTIRITSNCHKKLWWKLWRGRQSTRFWMCDLHQRKTWAS